MANIKRPCLFIGPIGDSDTDIRRHSDQVFHHLVEKVVGELGYKAERPDQSTKPGDIMPEIVRRLVTDPLVIADLSMRNPNVFYELAIRHGIQKPVIQLVSRNEGLPFDVFGTRTIHFDLGDPDKVEEAQKEIKAQVLTMEEPGFKMINPIVSGILLQALMRSDIPLDRSIASMMAELYELKRLVRALPIGPDEQFGRELDRMRIIKEVGDLRTHVSFGGRSYYLDDEHVGILQDKLACRPLQTIRHYGESLHEWLQEHHVDPWKDKVFEDCGLCTVYCVDGTVMFDLNRFPPPSGLFEWLKNVPKESLTKDVLDAACKALAEGKKVADIKSLTGLHLDSSSSTTDLARQQALGKQT